MQGGKGGSLQPLLDTGDKALSYHGLLHSLRQEKGRRMLLPSTTHMTSALSFVKAKAVGK